MRCAHEHDYSMVCDSDPRLMLQAVNPKKLPEEWIRVLRFVPPAVLGALVVPGMISLWLLQYLESVL